LGIKNKSSREEQVQFGDELKWIEIDKEFRSYALGNTRPRKAMDARRAAQVGLLVRDAMNTERARYKFRNMRIEPRTYQAILHLARRYNVGWQ
jgi:hypothetical protein